LQWSLADRRVFDGVRPLAHHFVLGVIGPHLPNPLNGVLGAYGERLSKGGGVVPNHTGSQAFRPAAPGGVLLVALWQK